MFIYYLFIYITFSCIFSFRLVTHAYYQRHKNFNTLNHSKSWSKMFLLTDFHLFEFRAVFSFPRCIYSAVIDKKPDCSSLVNRMVVQIEAQEVMWLVGRERWLAGRFPLNSNYIFTIGHSYKSLSSLLRRSANVWKLINSINHCYI